MEQMARLDELRSQHVQVSVGETSDCYDYLESGEHYDLESIYLDECDEDCASATEIRSSGSFTYYPTARDVLARVKKARSTHLPQPATSGCDFSGGVGILAFMLAILCYLQVVVDALKENAALFGKALDAVTLAPKIGEKDKQCSDDLNEDLDSVV
mmetsp:Transcript_1145/g.3248  ORF Transcript_1145/g.3248 Transcript_1145/m.3248 type:complete len:156 (-) Transcript_1145:1600-2067(-)